MRAGLHLPCLSRYYSQSPKSLELSGKNEMLIWCLTFLTSTWYIKNPFLKAKIVEVLFYGTWNWGEHRNVLTTLLNTHPVALKHLMPALMSFYIGNLMASTSRAPVDVGCRG